MGILAAVFLIGNATAIFMAGRKETATSTK